MSITYDAYNNPVLGHVRDSNGQFSFGPLHTDDDALTEVTGQKMTMPFHFFSVFAKMIVNSIQTQEFPYDLLRRMMLNSFEESEVVAYQTNIIITCVVVLLVMLGLIIVAIVYTVRHWRARKQNRHILKKQLFDQRRGRIIICFGFFMAVFNLAFLMLSLLVSTATNTAVTDMDKDVTGAMDGVSGYFNHSGEQWDFLANDTNLWSLISVIQSDTNDVGSLIWQPAVQGYSASLSSPFTATSNLDAELSQAVSYLNDMQNQINSIVTGSTGNSLTSVMSEIYYNLSFARNDFTCIGCDGSCAGCSDIVVNDIYYNMDFTTLTNVTSNLETLQALMGTTIANSLISPEFYFWKGIAAVIQGKAGVITGMTNLNSSLDAYSASISASTSGIVSPDEAVLKFDTFRPDWDTWYSTVKGQDGARYAFHLIFTMVNVVMLAILYFGWALLVLPGLVKAKPEDDNFKLPRRIVLICLIVSMVVASGLLILAVVGFYAGGNMQKVACEPTKNESIIRNTVDYSGGVPGHDGLFLSSIILGNGTLFPLYVSDTLEECRANNTTSYNIFHQDLLVPNIYTDLQYAPFFVNLTTDFNSMLVTLPNVTLVPPLLEEWFTNFTNAAFFNLTEYEEFLGKGAINAVLTTYTNNLLTVYNHAYPDGPLEPAKTRLYEVSQSLLGQEAALNQMTSLKSNVSSVFYQYKNLIESMQTNITNALADLRSHESTVQGLSGGYISTGVNLHKTTFAQQLQALETAITAWVTEIGPCAPLAYAYDQVYDSFCNKYSDNANATWMLVGIADFFLILVALTAFLLFREIPQVDSEGMDEALDIKKEFPKIFGRRSECCFLCCCCNKSRQEKRQRKYKAASRPQSRAQSQNHNQLPTFSGEAAFNSRPPQATRKP